MPSLSTSKKPAGRPAALSRDNLLKICTRVALGETLTAITKEPGQPDARSFRRAVMEDPEIREQWEIAKAERPHSLFEEAIDIARELNSSPWAKEQGNVVAAKRTAIEALREAAARLAPKEYGIRPASQTVVPIQINTSLDLSAGQPKQRQGSAAVYSIDVALPSPTEEPLPGLEIPPSPD